MSLEPQLFWEGFPLDFGVVLQGFANSATTSFVSSNIDAEQEGLGLSSWC